MASKSSEKVAEKKTRRTFTIEQKLEAIKLYEKKQDLNLVACKFGVRAELVRGWISAKDKLKANLKKNPTATKLIQRKNDLDEKFRNAIVSWIKRARARDVEISYQDLREKAEEMRLKRGLKSECTIPWLRTLVKKHGLELRSMPYWAYERCKSLGFI